MHRYSRRDFNPLDTCAARRTDVRRRGQNQGILSPQGDIVLCQPRPRSPGAPSKSSSTQILANYHFLATWDGKVRVEELLQV